MQRLALILALLLQPAALSAGDWIVSVGSGPFIFGDFAESREVISNGQSRLTLTHSLSAETAAGVATSIEYVTGERTSIRLDGNFTDAKLAIKTDSDRDDPEEGLSLDIGRLDVTVLSLALVWRFNRDGSLRPYVMAGPAIARYGLEYDRARGTVPLFRGERDRVGGVLGLGVEWWWRDNFAIRIEASDTVTKSPLSRSDFQNPSVKLLDIPEPHNIHGTAALAWRF